MAASSSLRGSTKETILDAVDVLMARYGFRKMSMEDVAREAGVSKRTIYMYFRSKEDVGLSSIGRVVENVERELEQISSSSKPAEERLRDCLTRRVMGRVEQVEAYAHSLDELFELVRPAYMARRAQYFDRERNLIASVLRDGGVDPAKATQVAGSLLLATNAFLPYSLTVKELGSPALISQRLASMIDVLIDGAFATGNKP
ncbi:MAG: TetR/AcrR family transcriptional regulator [Armatimonadetes bacterium]|nr:TetR/AcrR family transcriptional regulator [Armatimonadota bacterium]